MVNDVSQFPVAILAGGMATRLRPITESIPKVLVDVAGEPFLSHQLRLLRSAGLTKVVLCVGHLGEMIVSQYGDGSAWDMRIDYSFDGPRLLGTGGALIRALPLLGKSFFVLYGDSYLPFDYIAAGSAFVASRRSGLMTVFRNDGLYDASNVWFSNGEIRVYDKKHPSPQMKHIDYGLGLLKADALADWPRDATVDLAEIYGRLVEFRELAGFETDQRFYEIGSHAGLRELDRHLCSR